MPTSVQGQPTADQSKRLKQAASSILATLSTFKLDENLQAVMLFSLLGLAISCALLWLAGAELATWAVPINSAATTA